jgi:hypothetical protein
MGDHLRKIHVCSCVSCQRDPEGEVAREHRAINQVVGLLDERRRRLFVGLLASQWGHGRVVLLARITGLSRTTIRRGQLEIGKAAPDLGARVRQAGGGRKRLEKKSPLS